jgi:uncharacterized protein (TIGR03435 family)
MGPVFKFALFACVAGRLFAQEPAPGFDAFEVATVKPTPQDWRGGRFIRMLGPRQFTATNYTLRVLIAAAYRLNTQAVLGGPSWMDSDAYDIVAVTPGDVRPNLDQQLNMLQELLKDRFSLAFHRQERELPVYILSVAKNGPKLRPSQAPADEDPVVISHISPDHVELPVRNASIAQVIAVMQRSIFDRPILDRTGITGRYDFDLDWAPDEGQFGGQFSRTADQNRPSLFTAIQEQAGLKLEAGRGPVLALVIDKLERPSEN